MKRILVPFIALLLGCSGQTLDGGGGQKQQASTPGAGTEIASTPIAGTIDGKAFDAKAIFVYYSKTNAEWFFAIDNYENDCGTMKDRPDPASAMVVTVGSLDRKAGDTPLTYGDGHAATFQIGVYDTSDKATTYSIKDGTLRFDTWDETAGSEITGALKLVSDQGQIEGTFTAKVCAPRN